MVGTLQAIGYACRGVSAQACAPCS
jgi:hypothetical protein